jgi:ribulose bisphosphate carboxylase small subunit
MWNMIDPADAEELESRVLWLLADTISEKKDELIEILGLDSSVKEGVAREIISDISGELMRRGHGVDKEGQ